MAKYRVSAHSVKSGDAGHAAFFFRRTENDDDDEDSRDRLAKTTLSLWRECFFLHCFIAALML